MITVLLALVLTVAKSAVPDPALTPGALCTPAAVGFGGYTYPAHVAHCRRHVTQTIRRTVLASYGVPWSERRRFELDHRLPLCLGGSNEARNLWPEAWSDARRKDVLEANLCGLLRRGKVTQESAVEQMLAWRAR